MDTATKEGTTTRAGRYLAAAAVVLLVAVAAFATTRLGDGAEVQPIGEHEGTDGDGGQGAPADEPVPAAEATLRFTFTGGARTRASTTGRARSRKGRCAPRRRTPPPWTPA